MEESAMSVNQSSRQRLMAEIDRVVAEAVSGRAIIATDEMAARVARDFPGAGLSLAQIAAEIARKGVEAGAALEFGETR
jgi:hypothetical protein